MAMTVSTGTEVAESRNLYPKLDSCERHDAQKTKIFLSLLLTGLAREGKFELLHCGNENAPPVGGAFREERCGDQTLLSGNEALRSIMKACRASSMPGSSSGPL
ncbi:MAG: hypothetical protein Tsb0019_00270 [Roseibium sp.]